MLQFLIEEAAATALELDEAGQKLQARESADKAAAVEKARARAKRQGAR